MFIHHKDNKLPFHGASALQRNYKKNAIIEELHRANKISSGLEQEISMIKNSYLRTGHPSAFISSLINNFYKDKEYFLIPTRLFAE